jgi:hypothetical protein
MSETTVATSLGDRNGLSSVPLATVTELRALASTPQAETLLRLHPEHPFGVTVIIGGTNVRFCLSVPDRTEPIIESVRWTHLREELAPVLAKSGATFEQSKDVVYNCIAQKFSAFMQKHSPEGADVPPIQNLCAVNFSMAGIVEGEGFNAKVTTSNTALPMSEEQIALEVLGAINADLSERGWPQVKVDGVAVMNDAAAGLMGERLGGALQGIDNAMYIILGTGVGSYGLVNGKLSYQFAELGHRVTRNETSDDYTYHDDSELSTLIDEHNQFKAQSTEQWYAENELAGPWAAVKFLKHVKNGLRSCYHLLASKVADQLTPQRTFEEVKSILDQLIDLDYRDVGKWAVSSPSDVIKGVNSILFNHDAREITRAIECDMNIAAVAERGVGPIQKGTKYKNEAMKFRGLAARVRKELETTPPTDDRYAELVEEVARYQEEANRLTAKAEKLLSRGDSKVSKALTLAAYTEWQKYFKELAKFLETSYDAMKVNEAAPQRIVLAGGIGELCSRYDNQWKNRINELFEDFADNIPPGTVVFSTMSPEAREAYVTTAAVQQAFEQYKASRSVPSAETVEPERAAGA